VVEEDLEQVIIRLQAAQQSDSACMLGEQDRRRSCGKQHR
jgi:hypothetical protein